MRRDAKSWMPVEVHHLEVHRCILECDRWTMKHPYSSHVPVSGRMISRSWSETCGGVLGSLSRLSHLSSIKGSDMRAWFSRETREEEQEETVETVQRCCLAFPPAAAPQNWARLPSRCAPSSSSSWMHNMQQELTNCQWNLGLRKGPINTALSCCRPHPHAMGMQRLSGEHRCFLCCWSVMCQQIYSPIFRKVGKQPNM